MSDRPAVAGYGLPRSVARFDPRQLLLHGSLVVATAVLFSPGWSLGPSLDSAVFVLIGSRMRDGYVPYRDLWITSRPGSTC